MSHDNLGRRLAACVDAREIDESCIGGMIVAAAILDGQSPALPDCVTDLLLAAKQNKGRNRGNGAALTNCFHVRHYARRQPAQKAVRAGEEHQAPAVEEVEGESCPLTSFFRVWTK